MKNTKVVINYKAFTLIEIIVVVLLIGIIMSITIPRFIDLDDLHMKSQARRLSSLFRYVYSEAVTTGRSYRVCFDIDREAYWVEMADDSGQFTEFADTLTRKENLSEGIEFEDIAMPDAGKITEGRVFCYFYPRGLVDGLTIHLRNQRGNALSLMVDTWTAEVDIYQGYAERGI